MKKIVATIICLALCTLALVACDSENNVNNEISKYTGDGSLHVVSKNEVSNMPVLSHTLDHTAFVISGEEKITPKQFPGALKVTVELDGGIGKVYQACGSYGWTEVNSYTEDQLLALPSITLHGELKVELAEYARVQGVTVLKIGREGKTDEQTTLEALSELESGEYYIALDTQSESDGRIEDCGHVFRLIVE